MGEITDPRLKAKILAASKPIVDVPTATTAPDGTITMPMAPERVLGNQQTTGSIASTATSTEKTRRDMTADQTGREYTGGVDSNASEQRAGYLSMNMLNQVKNIAEMRKKVPEFQQPGWVETIGEAVGGPTGRGLALLAKEKLSGNGEDERSARLNYATAYNTFVSNALTLATGAAFKDDELRRMVAGLAPQAYDTAESRAFKWKNLYQTAYTSLLATGKSEAEVEKMMRTPAMMALEKFINNPDASAEEYAAFTDVQSGGVDNKPSTTNKMSKVPPEMQAEWSAFLGQYPRGQLPIEAGFAKAKELSEKYQTEPLENIEDFIKFYNEQKNIPISDTIQPKNVPLTAGEQMDAKIAGSEGGAGLQAFSNAMTLGGVEGVARLNGLGEEYNRNLEENPTGAMIGDIVGSIAPVMGAEKLLGKGLNAIPDAARQFMPKAFSDEARKALLADLGANMAYGGIRGATDDDTSVAGAALGSGLAAIGGRAIAKGTPRAFGSEKLIDDLDTLKDVKLSTFQKAGGGKIEEAFSGVPGPLGARRSAQESYNLADVNRTLKLVGEKLPAGTDAGTDAIKHMNTVLNAKYNALRPKITGQVDKPFQTAVAAIGVKVAQGTSGEAKAYYRSEIAPLYQQLFDANGKFTGDSYKAVVQKLRAHQDALLTRAENNGDVWAQDLSRDLEKMQKQIRALVSRNDPVVGSQLKNLETAWAKSIRIEDAVTRASGNGGVYTPSQRLASIKKYDNSSRKSAFSRGDALDQDYGEAGQRVMGAKGVPDSFNFWQTGAVGLVPAANAALGAGGVSTVGPLVAAVAAVTGLGAYTPVVKNIVAEILAGKRPAIIDNPLVRQALSQSMATDNRLPQGDQ